MPTLGGVRHERLSEQRERCAWTEHMDEAAPRERISKRRRAREKRARKHHVKRDERRSSAARVRNS